MLSLAVILMFPQSPKKARDFAGTEKEAVAFILELEQDKLTDDFIIKMRPGNFKS